MADLKPQPPFRYLPTETDRELLERHHQRLQRILGGDEKWRLASISEMLTEIENRLGRLDMIDSERPDEYD